MSEDVEMAKLLLTQGRQLEEAMCTVAELRNSIKVNRLGLKELQDRYEHLMYKVHRPQDTVKPGQRKLLGFRVVRIDQSAAWLAPGQQANDVRDILSAVELMLSQPNQTADWGIKPVYEGEVANPQFIDEQDIEDGECV